MRAWAVPQSPPCLCPLDRFPLLDRAFAFLLAASTYCGQFDRSSSDCAWPCKDNGEVCTLNGAAHYGAYACSGSQVRGQTEHEGCQLTVGGWACTSKVFPCYAIWGLYSRKGDDQFSPSKGWKPSKRFPCVHNLSVLLPT